MEYCKGWERYKQLSERNSEKIKNLVEDERLNMEEVMKKFEGMHKKIKFQAFGKTTSRAGPNCPVRGLAGARPSPLGPAQGHPNEEEVAKELIEKQNKMLDKEVEKIREGNNGKFNQIFKIAKQLKGTSTSQAHAVKDPVTKKLVVDQKEIKQVSLNHCKKVLEKNEPKEEMRKMFDVRERLIEERLRERGGHGFETSKEVYDQVLLKFKANNKRNYDFLMKASEEFKGSVFLLC